MDDDRGDWMQTHSGVKFYPCNPRPEEVLIEDIAHALAHQCRFAGHTRHHYSVAQHSVLVSYACAPFDALWGLLHDATEAYLVDVPRPIKRSRWLAGYVLLEEYMERVVAQRFSLILPIPESVKRADVVLLATERRDLLDVSLAAERQAVERVEPLAKQIEVWTPGEAKARFLARFRELQPSGAADFGREPDFTAVFRPSSPPPVGPDTLRARADDDVERELERVGGVR